MTVPEEADGQRAGEDEPDDAAWVIVRCLARGAPLAALFRRQGPLWYRDGSGAAFEWSRLVDMDETHSPVRMVPAADRDRLAAQVAGMVPLADVLDALRDDDAYHRWRTALTGVRPEYPPLTTRHHLADYLAERFAPSAPEADRG
jgi:hypothetical protein